MPALVVVQYQLHKKKLTLKRMGPTNLIQTAPPCAKRGLPPYGYLPMSRPHTPSACTPTRHQRSPRKICCAAACGIMLQHAAACGGMLQVVG